MKDRARGVVYGFVYEVWIFIGRVIYLKLRLPYTTVGNIMLCATKMNMSLLMVY